MQAHILLLCLLPAVLYRILHSFTLTICSAGSCIRLCYSLEVFSFNTRGFLPIHVPCFKLFHYVICRQLWFESSSYVYGGITFSKTVELQCAVLLKTARRCSLKILIFMHSGHFTGFCKHLSVNHCKKTLGGFSQIHVYYNKLLYYAISLHLWSEFLGTRCGALIFIRFIRLAACYLGKNGPFWQMLHKDSGIYVFWHVTGSHAWPLNPSFLTVYWLLNLPLLITRNGVERFPTDARVLP